MSDQSLVTAANTPYVAPIEDMRYSVCLRRIYRVLGTWRRVAKLLGYSPAYWRSIAYGKLSPSLEARNRLRHLAGKPPVNRVRIRDLEPDELRDYIKHRRPILLPPDPQP